MCAFTYDFNISEFYTSKKISHNFDRIWLQAKVYFKKPNASKVET